MSDTLDSLRIDKWLWAARFFKTRALAAEAINGGKIKINGNQTKPARKLKIGDSVSVSRGQTKMTVIVAGLNNKRRPAPEAVLLYNETLESQTEREKIQALHKLDKSTRAATQRPTKKQRRQIIQFKQK